MSDIEARILEPAFQAVIQALREQEEKIEYLASLLADSCRDTIPSPPAGDSHSGAIVVPRGSSAPPGLTALVQVGGADLPPGAMGRIVGDPVVDVDGACPHCRMLSCSCESYQT